MVTPAEFDKVQSIIHSDPVIRPKKHEFPFTGLIKCKTCGGAITAEKRVKKYSTSGNSKEYIYYHCTGLKGCKKDSVSEQYLEGQISKLLDDCTLNPAMTDWLKKVCKRHYLESSGPEQAVLESVRQSIKATEKRIGGLFDMRADGEITADDFKEKQTRYNGELFDLKDQEQTIENQIKELQHTTENLLDFSESAFERFTKGDVKVKKEVAIKLGVSYYLTLEGLEIVPHPLLNVVRDFVPWSIDPLILKREPSLSLFPTWQGHKESNLG